MEQKQTENKVTKQILINELIEKHPQVAEILTSYGLHCVGCHFSSFDTLEDASMIHGIDEEEIDMMVRDVNKILSLSKEEIKNV